MYAAEPSFILARPDSKGVWILTPMTLSTSLSKALHLWKSAPDALRPTTPPTRWTSHQLLTQALKTSISHFTIHIIDEVKALKRAKANSERSLTPSFSVAFISHATHAMVRAWVAWSKFLLLKTHRVGMKTMHTSHTSCCLADLCSSHLGFLPVSCLITHLWPLTLQKTF